MERKILLTDCPDAKGLIAKITNICYKHQLNIIQNNEFVDHRSSRFFMRTELEGIFNDTTLLADLDDALPEGTKRQLVSASRKKIVILVTKEAHCLGDLLMKAYYGGLE
ncbi:MAG: ACT domain-containing protein, partial [Plesiomonas shigelloides]